METGYMHLSRLPQRKPATLLSSCNVCAGHTQKVASLRYRQAWGGVDTRG